MIPLIAAGLGGLVWYAQRAQAEPELDPGMSAALRREVLALTKRELSAQQLQSLVDELGRAHYHRAQQLFATRLRGSTDASLQPPNGSAEGARLEAALAKATSPAVLLSVAEVLDSLGQLQASARARARAAELESASQLDELLPIAPAPVSDVSAELSALEKELGSFDHDDEEEDADDEGEQAEPAADGAGEAEPDATESAALEGEGPSPSTSSGRGIGSALSAESPTPNSGLDWIAAAYPGPDAGNLPSVPGVIDTQGVEATLETPARPNARRRPRARASVDLGGQDGS